MKFVIKKDLLVNCLKNVNNLIDSNNPNLTLTAVHIKASNDKIIFTATNGSSSYQQTIANQEIKEAGEILVKARLLYNYVSKINQETISINQIDERILQISTPNFSTEINLIDNSSFPILFFEYKDWKKLTLTYDTLLSISQRIKPFISTSFSNTNPSISGILFNPIDEKQMECVASDSHRMAYYKFDYEGDAVKFVLDPKAIDMSIELLTISKGKSIDFYISDKKCIIKNEDVLIEFVLFNVNTYPNITNAILSKQKHSFKLNLNNLINALNRGSVLVANEQRPIANLKIENKKLNLKFLSAETGNSFEEIDLIESTIDNFETKLNQKYLLSLINTIKSETISFNFNGSNSPIIISSDNPYFLNLILPLKS